MAQSHVLSGSRNAAPWGRVLDYRPGPGGAASARAGGAAQAGPGTALSSSARLWRTRSLTRSAALINRANDSADTPPAPRYRNHCLRLLPVGPSEESEQRRGLMENSTDHQRLNSSVNSGFLSRSPDRKPKYHLPDGLWKVGLFCVYQPRGST